MQIGLGPSLTVVATVLAGVEADNIVLPAMTNGINSAISIEPQYIVSPDRTMYAVGTIKADGKQVVQIYDTAAGELIEESFMP
jgi:hypothetical protein